MIPKIRQWTSDHPFLVLIALNAVLGTAMGFLFMSELGGLSQ